MSQDDIARFQRRAAEERERASSASDARIADVHKELADKYEAVAAAYANLGKWDRQGQQD
jgi:hypothetical protein